MKKTQSHLWSTLSLILTILFAILAIFIITENSPHAFPILKSLDNSAEYFFGSLYSPSLTALMLFFTHLADPLVIILFQLFVIALLFSFHKNKLSAVFTLALVIGEALVIFFKDLIARIRPDIILASPITKTDYSFPSGHAFISIVFYGFLGYLLVQAAHENYKNKKIYKTFITVIICVIIFMIGMSRIYLGVHWLSDIVGGWLMGGAVLCALISSQKIALRLLREISHPKKHKIIIVCFCVVVLLAFLTVYMFVAAAPDFRSIVYT